MGWSTKTFLQRTLKSSMGHQQLHEDGTQHRAGRVPVCRHCFQDLVQQCQHGSPGKADAGRDMQRQGAQSWLMQRAGDGPAQHCADDGEHHDVCWRRQSLSIRCGLSDGCNAFNYGLLVYNRVPLTLACNRAKTTSRGTTACLHARALGLHLWPTEEAPDASQAPPDTKECSPCLDNSITRRAREMARAWLPRAPGRVCARAQTASKAAVSPTCEPSCTPFVPSGARM